MISSINLPISWSIPTKAMVIHPDRRALIGLVAPATTVVADDNGYTVTAAMAWMTTISANYVTKRTSNYFWWWQA